MSSERGLGWVREVRVGTMNRPKLGAVRAALAPFAPQARISGAEVASGVPEQPVGFEEILAGAAQRARAALAAGADLGVGIEDGLLPFSPGVVTGGDAEHLNLGCAVVTDGERLGYGLSSGFAYPPELTGSAVADREPIGPAFDRFWQTHRKNPSSASGVGNIPSGRSVGNVGKLTGGVLTRQEYGRHAVVCALVRFLHPDLYGDAPSGVST